jgi:hypothetical protein
VFRLDSVHSKGKKRPFLRHKIHEIKHFEGSDPTGNLDLGFMF